MPIPHFLVYWSFVVSFEIKEYGSSNFILLQNWFVFFFFWNLLRFHMNFGMDFSISAKNVIGV